MKELQSQVAAMKTVHQIDANYLQEDETTALRRQVAELKSQMSTLRAQNLQIGRKPQHSETGTRGEMQLTRSTGQSGNSRPTSNRPRPWYCFRCGEDGHMAPGCANEQNPALVEEKRHQCKERQLQWDRLNC